MKEKMKELLKQIKQSFRLLMNGETARSMREKGLDYHLNWGASLPHLQEMAQEYDKDYDLAIALWKEDIRECKILASMLMPPEKMERELADIWMEQTHSQEIAELTTKYLYQFLDDAPEIAYEWIATEEPLKQLSGYHILSFIFKSGKEPNERGINELIDQVQVVMEEGNLGVKHAAMNCMIHFCELGEDYRRVAVTAIPALR